MGLAWMLPTGFVAANFLPTAEFLAGTNPTDEALLNISVGLGVALVVSLGLFYWALREALRGLGRANGMPMSLIIGGVAGGVLGAGPITVFKLFIENGAPF